jgi:hypothetical protein
MGSNPIADIKLAHLSNDNGWVAPSTGCALSGPTKGARVAQLVEASDLESEDYRFESYRGYYMPKLREFHKSGKSSQYLQCPKCKATQWVSIQTAKDNGWHCEGPDNDTSRMCGYDRFSYAEWLNASAPCPNTRNLLTNQEKKAKLNQETVL